MLNWLPLYFEKIFVKHGIFIYFTYLTHQTYIIVIIIIIIKLYNLYNLFLNGGLLRATTMGKYANTHYFRESKYDHDYIIHLIITSSIQRGSAWSLHELTCIPFESLILIKLKGEWSSCHLQKLTCISFQSLILVRLKGKGNMRS